MRRFTALALALLACSPRALSRLRPLTAPLQTRVVSSDKETEALRGAAAQPRALFSLGDNPLAWDDDVLARGALRPSVAVGWSSLLTRLCSDAPFGRQPR